MKKFILVFVMIFAIAGCASITNNLSEPPNLKLKTSNGTFDTVLGTYCWEVKTNQSECVDKVGPTELVKDQQVIEVESGEKIQFVLDESLRPETAFLTWILQEEEKDVLLKEDYSFLAPTTAGEYIYGFTGKWELDDKGKSSGEAQYVFKLVIK